MRASVAIMGFLLGGTAVLDMDFHWHLALGQGLVAHGFPTSEPFSHLPVGAPDHQSWLADAMFAVLDRIGGLAAIRVVLGAVFAAGCLSVLRLVCRRTRSAAVALVPVAIYVALAMARLRVRPDLFTLALLPLFVELLERAPTWRRPLVLLVVSAVWANLHAGSLIAGLLAIAQLWPPAPIRFANVAATCAGLCLTPDGIHGLLRYTADTTELRPLIPEWQRLWERPFAEFAPEWAVVGGLGMFCGWALGARLREGPPAKAGQGPQPALTAGWGGGGPGALLGIALAASAVRFLFALVLPALWAVSVLDRVIAPRAQLRAAALVTSIALVLAFPIGYLKDVTTGLKAAGISFLGPDSPAFPVEATQYLATSGLSGNLAHPASWGGYLALHLNPRFKTATDGRITHFGADLGREWSEGVNTPAREEIFARRGIDFVVVPRLALSSFPDHLYEVLYADSFAVVLIRYDGPNHVENIRMIKAALKRR